MSQDLLGWASIFPLPILVLGLLNLVAPLTSLVQLGMSRLLVTCPHLDVEEVLGKVHDVPFLLSCFSTFMAIWTMSMTST